MTIRLRTAFFLLLGVLILWFINLEKEIFTPFILAAVFAYVINPLVSFLSEKTRLPRVISIIAVFAVILGLLIFGSISLSKRALEESSQLQDFAQSLKRTANFQVENLPEFARPAALDALSSLNESKFLALSLSIVPRALSGVISLVIFLFAGFFFLNEGRSFVDRLLNFIPNVYKIEVEILLRKVNSVFGGYLRGQLFLVFFVSSILFIILSILGIKFALVLAIFSGFAELVPFIGPIVAGGVAASTAFITRTSNFALSPEQLVLAVIIIYFIVRQFEDYFVIPTMMGKITKLHPLVILFAVLAGGHIGGVMGLILAVPIAGMLRIILEFCLDKINRSSKGEGRR